MKRTDKPTPGTGAPQRKYNTVGPARTPSKTPTGRKATKPVEKVQPKGALKKSVVRNPKAPKPVGSGTSVTLLKKAESFLKREKAGRNRSGVAASNKNTAGRGKTVGGFPLTSDKQRYSQTNADRRLKAEQRVKNTPDRGSMSSYNDLKARDAMMRSAAGGKGNKPSGVTPKKKTPPTPPKSGRGGRGGRGGFGGRGFGGGGGLYGNMFKR